jgi:hypothetical protein
MRNDLIGSRVITKMPPELVPWVHEPVTGTVIDPETLPLRGDGTVDERMYCEARGVTPVILAGYIIKYVPDDQLNPDLTLWHEWHRLYGKKEE